MNPLIPSILPLLAAAATALPTARPVRRAVFGAGAILSSLAAVLTTAPVLISGQSITWGPLLIDRFAAYIICLVAIVSALAALAGIHYLAHGEKEGSITDASERIFCVFFPLFVLSMWTASSADNLALLWIALESTTLTTTLLVAFDRSRGAVEAAWKYIIICSTGITLGLFGVLMLIHSGTGANLGADALALSSLKAHASLLSVSTLRWAFVFLFIGVGTKVGFVPMHTWLPDAHSKTPAPISAMLSGMLLNVAFAVLLRAKIITDAAAGSPAWTEKIFLIFGLLSIALPAFIILVQKNYKRMLAYSSIEHMGLMAFAVGLGPAGLLAALIHMAGHAVAKPALFVGAGEVLHEYRTTRIDEVRGVIRRLPKTGTLFFLSLLALLAAPPSALFMSEFIMTGYGMSRHPILTIIVLALLAIVAFGMMRSTVTMLFSKETEKVDTETVQDSYPRGAERWNLATVAVLINVALCLILGAALLTSDGLRSFIALFQSLS